MPAAIASGLPESVPAWKTGPAGMTFFMMSARPPYAPTGKPPPTILPSTVRSGVSPKQLLRPAVGQAEAGHHLVVDQQRAVLLRQPAQFRAELGRRRDQAHVADDRLEDDAGDLVALRLERFAQRRRRRCSAARACRRCSPSARRGCSGTPSVVALDPAETSRLSTWPW